MDTVLLNFLRAVRHILVAHPYGPTYGCSKFVPDNFVSFVVYILRSSKVSRLVSIQI